MRSGAEESVLDAGMKGEETSGRIFGIFALIFFAAAAVVNIIVRARLLDMPLNRDEAVWAYAGTLYLKGIAPYAQVFDTKLPGVSYIYAVFMAIFGENTISVRMSLVCISIIAGFFIYKIARNYFSRAVSMFAAGIYAVFSMDISVEGLTAYTEHYAAAFVLAGIYAAMIARNRNSMAQVFISGVLCSAAVLCRQTVVFMAALAFFYCLPQKGEKGAARNMLYFTAGFMILFVLVAAQVILSGAAGKAAYILLGHSATYAGLVDIGFAVLLLWEFLKSLHAGSWMIAVVFTAGIVLAACRPAKESSALFVLLFFIASVISAIIVPHFRPHYFLLTVPACTMAAAYLLDKTGSHAAVKTAVIVFITAASALALIEWRSIFFSMSPEEVSAKVYMGNPFVQGRKAGEYLKQKTKQGDTIAVLGSEPEIYFYSKRKAATEFFFCYDLMWAGKKSRELQIELIRQVEQAHPAYVVFVNIPISWRIPPGVDMTIFQWYEKYRAEKLELDSVIDMLSQRETKYRFGKEAVKKYKAGGYRIDIFRVKEK